MTVLVAGMSGLDGVLSTSDVVAEIKAYVDGSAAAEPLVHVVRAGR